MLFSLDSLVYWKSVVLEQNALMYNLATYFRDWGLGLNFLLEILSILNLI